MTHLFPKRKKTCAGQREGVGIRGSTEQCKRDAGGGEKLAETWHEVGHGADGRRKRRDFIEGMSRGPCAEAGGGIGIFAEHGRTLEMRRGTRETIGQHVAESRDTPLAQRVVLTVTMLAREGGDGDWREVRERPNFRK